MKTSKSGINPFATFRRTVYHGLEWERLVETGWTTAYVENGIAYMLPTPKPYYRW